MLIVNIINTLPNRKDRNIEDFDELSQRDELSKRIGRRENIFQNKYALVPREEGATVAATPTFSFTKTVRAVSCGPDGQRSP